MISLQKPRFTDGNQHGMMMVSILVISTVLVLIGFALTSLTASQYALSNRKVYTSNALMVAEAGIEQTLYQLNSSASFTGYGEPQVFFDNATQGRGEFTTTITNSVDSKAKTIIATGVVYRYGQSTAASTRSVKVTVVGTGSKGYSVHTGPGGLILGGSANITNSDVYVNGGITLNGSAKIGTYAQPLKVNVANQQCPTGNNPGPTYPQVCSSVQPITTAWSTAIYGTVCATGQTSNNNGSGNPAGNILPGSSGGGLMLGCIAPVVNPPTYDRAGQIAAVSVTGASNDNTYVCKSWPFNRTWPANLKLTGNVSIAGSCNIVITGDAYITGNLSIGGASKITVADSLGTTRPVVMVDGTITINGSSQMIANSSGTGIHFVSFKSTASCSPNCTSLSGNDLKSSQNLETVDVGGGVNLPGMIFQAYWGKAVLAGGGSVGSIIGQTVDMSGAGTVTFGTTLSSGESTWTVTSYQEIFP